MDKINSVLSIRVIKGIYRADRPYTTPSDRESSGSGFIIDIEKGLVVTNAHVVSNAISIIGRSQRTGRKDLSLDLLGICREKDVAICKISSADIALIIMGLNNDEIGKINLKFGDSMNVNPGDAVITLGYPLDSINIKITTGVVSGFEIVNEEESSSLNELEDSYLRSPSYIQISAAINPGNSGGPLFNSKNQVIGINAGGYPKGQNVGYAIPSRTFLAVYNELISSAVVKMPTLALEWCKTSRELMKKQTGSSSTYGIYVRKVYPDTCFDLLEKGDIIRRIDYLDIFWTANSNDNFKNGFTYSNSDTNNSVLVTVFLDRFGMSTKIGKLKNPDEVDESKIEFEKIFTERKMDLSEIMDMIPIGTDIILNISRNLSWYMLKSKYIAVENERIPHVYPRITPYEYEIFAGLCVSNLDVAHFSVFDNLKCYSENLDNRYKKQVIIVQVFPDSSAYRTQSLKPGHLVKSVIGYTANFELIPDTNRLINSIDDIRHILHLKPDQIQITTTDESVFFIPLSVIIKEDKNILNNYKIPHKYILE